MALWHFADFSPPSQHSRLVGVIQYLSKLPRHPKDGRILKDLEGKSPGSNDSKYLIQYLYLLMLQARCLLHTMPIPIPMFPASGYYMFPPSMPLPPSPHGMPDVMDHLHIPSMPKSPGKTLPKISSAYSTLTGQKRNFSGFPYFAKHSKKKNFFFAHPKMQM
ncbi:hypothetical protein EDD15DRAFT_2201672 [Pisolithus albus]|nr:hypothetical protein EDD15DRAFT_2201672 [Pisolithus albus]